MEAGVKTSLMTTSNIHGAMVVEKENIQIKLKTGEADPFSLIYWLTCERHGSINSFTSYDSKSDWSFKVW